MNLVGIFIRRFFYPILIVLILLVLADGLEVAFGQVYIINLARLVHLEGDVVGLYHTNGDGIEQLAVFIPVGWVFGKDLLVVLNIGGHGVAAVVPHILVVHAADAVHAQLINHALSDRIHTSIGCYGVKVWFFFDTVVDYGVVIRNFDSHHL